MLLKIFEKNTEKFQNVPKTFTLHKFNKTSARFFNVFDWRERTTGFPTILLPTIGWRTADIGNFQIPQLNG